MVRVTPVAPGREVDLFALDDVLVVLGADVWVSDGTQSGTKTYGEAGLYVGDAAALSDAVVFTAYSGPDRVLQLWRADADALVPLRALGEEASGSVEEMVTWRGAAAFAFDGKLWTSDGTTAGTRVLIGLPFAGPVHGMVATAGALFLVGDDFRLWATDGTTAGTLDLGITASDPLAVGGRLLFRASNGSVTAWWSSDGTAAGTAPLPSPLADEVPFRATAWPLGDHAVLTRKLDRNGPWELILTDGTDAGTQRLGTFDGEGPNDTEGPTGFARLGDAVFFTAFDRLAGKELWAFHLDGSPPLTTLEPCVADATTLCLLDGRFRMRAEWRDPRTGRDGIAGARPFPGSDRTGVFWFFDPANVELVVKQLDGSGVNGFYWTFWGALTDVEYWIEVRDMERRLDRTFHNTPRTICGRGGDGGLPGGASRRPPPPRAAPTPAPCACTTAASRSTSGGATRAPATPAAAPPSPAPTAAATSGSSATTTSSWWSRCSTGDR